MHRIKYLLGCIAAGLLFAAGTVVAGAGQTEQAPPVGDGDAQRAAVGPITSEMRTVAIEPCRIVDTRFGGGGRLSNETRNFDARGALSGQGGASDCGIPSSAEAIEGNITAVDPGPKGFLRVKAFDGDANIPSGTVVNYAGSGITNATTIPLCVGACATDFSIGATGNSTHVVIDVTAYMVPPMFITFGGDDGNVTVSAKRLQFNTDVGTGVYTFDVTDGTDISGCAFSGTAGESDDSNDQFDDDRIVGAHAIDKDTIEVTAVNSAGTAVDEDIMLVVHC